MKKFQIALLALLAVAAAITVGCGSSSKNPTFSNMSMWSTRTVTPATNLFTMSLTGASITPIQTGSPDSIWGLSVSADFKTLAYASNGEVWAVNPSTGTPTQLTQNTANSAFSEVARISPNGKQIVYPVYPNSTDLASLWIMNSDGTGAVNLTPTLPTGMLNCYVASFSADSSKVVFACAGSTSYGLYTVHTDGTSLTTVLTQSTEIDSPAFSPNGQQILFVTYGTPGVAAKRDQSFTRLGRGRLRGHLQAQTGSSNQAIASVNIDGSNPTTIVTAPNAIWELEILNSNLYYMTEPSTVNFYQLFQANLDGTGSASISDGTADDELGICGGC